MKKEITKSESLKQLQTLRNIGPATAARLYSIGIRSPKQLKNSNPRELYERLKKQEGGKLDKCVLYVIQGAILNIAWPKCKQFFNPET